MINVRRTHPPTLEPLLVRRALSLSARAQEYQLRDVGTDYWLASFDQPDELNAAVDMVLLRFDAKEVP